MKIRGDLAYRQAKMESMNQETQLKLSLQQQKAQQELAIADAKAAEITRANHSNSQPGADGKAGRLATRAAHGDGDRGEAFQARAASRGQLRGAGCSPARCRAAIRAPRIPQLKPALTRGS
jgi:hypothetical protein